MLLGLIVVLLLLEVGLRLGGLIYYSCRIVDRPGRLVDKNTIRVLCIGDSFTFGAGAPKNYTYPEHLQRMLNSGSTMKAVVYNEGIPGSNSSQHFKILESKIQSHRPDIIIVMSGGNNKYNLEQSSYFLFKKNGDSRYLYKVDNLLSYAKSYKFLKMLLENLQNKILLSYGRHVGSDVHAAGKKDPRQDMEINEKLSEEVEKHCRLGQGYLKDRDLFCAMKEFRKALKLNPQHYPAYLQLGDVYSCQGKYRAAEEMLKKAIEISPDNKLAHDLLWNTYWCAGKHELALETIKKELSIYPLDRNLRQILIWGLPSLHENEIFERILEYDLENMIILSRDRRAKIILLGYPNGDGNDELRKRLAEKWQILFIDNKKSFAELKLSDNYSRGDYFVEDGHCNANGYRIIAENINKTLMAETIKEPLE